MEGNAFTEILSYAVFLGFEFAALCAMARVGRGWLPQALALPVLVGVDCLLDYWWRLGRMPLSQWLAVCFGCNWAVCSGLIVGLSREAIGRRFFLSLVYGAYCVCFSATFHFLVYRDALERGGNVFGLSGARAVALGLVVVALMYLVFFRWVLPRMPHDGRGMRWREPCVVAAVMFAALFASGLWPVSVLTAPVLFCVPFALMSVVAWVAFPLLSQAMCDRRSRIAAEHGLELMVAEVNVRRAALDEARRDRHDRRHHRIVLGDLLLKGRTKAALDYLNSLDEVGADLSTAVRIWCENETVNAILAGLARKAETNGVGFSAEAHVERTVPLPDAEMVAVVANLVENAINAAGDGDGDSKVSVILRQRGDTFGLTVANPVPPGFRLSPSGLPCAEPGVGLDSVRRVVERHSGDWQYTLAEGVLTCELMVCVGSGT